MKRTLAVLSIVALVIGMVAVIAAPTMGAVPPKQASNDMGYWLVYPLGDDVVIHFTRQVAGERRAFGLFAGPANQPRLVQDIFRIRGVYWVLLDRDEVWVIKYSNYDWYGRDDIIPKILGVLKEHFAPKGQLVEVRRPLCRSTAGTTVEKMVVTMVPC